MTCDREAGTVKHIYLLVLTKIWNGFPRIIKNIYIYSSVGGSVPAKTRTVGNEGGQRCQMTPYLLQTGFGTCRSQILLWLGTNRARIWSKMLILVVHWKLSLFRETLLACYKGRLGYVQIFLFLHWFIKKEKNMKKREVFHFTLPFKCLLVNTFKVMLILVPDASMTVEDCLLNSWVCALFLANIFHSHVCPASLQISCRMGNAAQDGQSFCRSLCRSFSKNQKWKVPLHWAQKGWWIPHHAGLPYAERECSTR